MRESTARDIWKSGLSMADRLNQAFRGERVRVEEQERKKKECK